MWRLSLGQAGKCLSGSTRFNGLSICQAPKRHIPMAGLPVAAKSVQLRAYAVAAEETNKGVVTIHLISSQTE